MGQSEGDSFSSAEILPRGFLSTQKYGQRVIFYGHSSTRWPMAFDPTVQSASAAAVLHCEHAGFQSVRRRKWTGRPIAEREFKL